MLLTLGLSTPLFAQPESTIPTIAVLTFRAEGLSASAAEALSNVVRRNLVNNNHFTLVDRDRADQILGEHAFLQAGACLDVACMVEAGKLLGAQQVVSGSINRLGRKYMIELRSVDVATGEIVALETGEHLGDVEELDEPVERISEHLVARMTNSKGVLIIETKPVASSVEIDGNPIGFAPLTIKRPAGVTYEISAVRMGYHSSKRSIYLTEDDTVTVKLKLSKLPKNRHRPQAMRLWVTGGFPFEQLSSNFDSKLSLEEGNTIGAAVSFGYDWRLRFGLLEFESLLGAYHPDIKTLYDIESVPESKSTTIYATLIYSGSEERFGSFIGGGLAGIRREVGIQFVDHEAGANSNGLTEMITNTTDFELGWCLQLGLEIGILRNLACQIEFFHVQMLSDSPDYVDQNPDDPLHGAWVEAFRSFDRHTSLRFSVGYRI